MKTFDDTFRRGGVSLIAGVDEAGRGPLAGPVVAAAVILPPDVELPEVNDSKQLTAAKRETMFKEINATALDVRYTVIEPEEIDRINILQASLKAMRLSVEALEPQPHLALVDGNKLFTCGMRAEAVVKGDGKSLSIAAASIVAKVVRDRIMLAYADDWPDYLWHKNKGYPTQAHIAAIRQHGPTPLHRKTFLRNIIGDPQLAIFGKTQG